jgi:hypothetical protein
MLRIIVLVLLASFLSGCTLLGAGIGAATSHYVPDTYARPGTTVRAQTSQGDVIEGVVTRNDLNGVVIEGDGRAYELPIDRIRRLERRESNIGTGAGIGAVIDVLCLVGGVIAVSAVFSSFHGFGGFGGY